MRVIPLLTFSKSKISDVRASTAQLLTATPDKLGEITNRDLPSPADALERQLFGDDKTPRPLLVNTSRPSLDNGGRQGFTGVLIYVPITDAQEAVVQPSN